LGGGTTPLSIICFVTPHGNYMHFFLGLPSVSPKIGTFVISNFWTFISSSNQAFLEHAKTLHYKPLKDLSNCASHAPITYHLTPFLTRFVVKSQIPNLTLAPSFVHNSCILCLYEQCEGILGIYTSRPF
jgi:hypothetical protein